MKSPQTWFGLKEPPFYTEPRHHFPAWVLANKKRATLYMMKLYMNKTMKLPIDFSTAPYETAKPPCAAFVGTP